MVLGVRYNAGKTPFLFGCLTFPPDIAYKATHLLLLKPRITSFSPSVILGFVFNFSVRPEPREFAAQRSPAIWLHKRENHDRNHHAKPL